MGAPGAVDAPVTPAPGSAVAPAVDLPVAAPFASVASTVPLDAEKLLAYRVALDNAF
jgi:hypothetical protein